MVELLTVVQVVVVDMLVIVLHSDDEVAILYEHIAGSKDATVGLKSTSSLLPAA